MPEYIKRVGEEKAAEMKRLLAERLKNQQNEEMPEIKTHTQGIAEALRRGIAGFQAGRAEKEIGEMSKAQEEQNAKRNQALLSQLGFGGQRGEGDMGGNEMGMGGQGGGNNFDLSGLDPQAQSILIDRELKNRDMTRKEQFKASEGEKNRANARELVGLKSQAGVEAHKSQKEFDSEQKKLEKMEEQGEAAQNSIREIDSVFESMAGAKPGVGFDTRQYLANAAQSLGMDTSKLNLGNPGDMLQLKKGLEQLVINMAKEFGSRVLKVEVEGVRAALPNASSSPEALTQVLSRIRNIKQYSASRPSKARSWYERYGSLNSRNENGQNFNQAYDDFAQNKWFARKENEEQQ